MRLLGYPDYKDSGVHWLGPVPSHWRLTKLRYLATFSGGGTPSRDNPKFWGGTLPWVSPKDMKATVISDAQESITEQGLSESSTSVIPPGALLIVVRSGILQHTIPVAQNVVPVALNQDMKALRFARDCQAEFFLRWIQGHNDDLLLVWAKQGATVESIEHSYMANTVVPLPPVDEQSAIAAFLDRETGKIDALVEAQRQLIELLKEKRQAVISHAVTKGLDPTVPMKDSGVEWLGEVPAHWEIARLKRSWDVIDCKHLTAEFVDDGFPLASIRESQGRYVDLTLAKRTTKAFYDLLIEGGRKPRPGDLIFTRNATVGEVAQVATWHPPFALGQDVCLLSKRDQSTSTEFTWYVSKSASTQRQLDELMIGSTFKRINIEEIRGLVVPIPPAEEQKAISGYLDRLTQNYDSSLNVAATVVSLLQERRSALISAAVTGKIDVRGLVPEEAEAA